VRILGKPKLVKRKKPKPNKIEQLLGEIKERTRYLETLDPDKFYEDQKEYNKEYRALGAAIEKLKAETEKQYHRKKPLRKWEEQSAPKTLQKVLIHIRQNTMSISKVVNLVDQGRVKDVDFVIFKPDYNRMTRDTGLKDRECLRYLSRLCEMGVIEKIGKDGSRGSTLYKVGYRTYYNEDGIDKSHRHWLWTKAKHEKAFKNFTLRTKNQR
jgi:hypothetical protein